MILNVLFSSSGVTTVEIRTVNEVDLVGTTKTWKSFNESMEDFRKALEPIFTDIFKRLKLK